MTPRLLVVAALLCALPASGGGVPPTPAQLDALSTIDAVPSRTLIDAVFPAGTSVAALIAIATDPARDLGVQVRALRTLPQYCPPTSCAGTVIHQALASIVDDYRAQLASAALSPRDVLRLRAAIEALGATRSGAQSDVDLLTAPALLHHPSRDVQVTAVHALRRLCSPDLCTHDACVQDANAVRTLRTGGDTQVDAAINSALQDLAQCSQP
jgi:hypothetical protein